MKTVTKPIGELSIAEVHTEVAPMSEPTVAELQARVALLERAKAGEGE